MQAKALEEEQRKAVEEAEAGAKVQMLAVSCVCMF